MAEYRKLFDPGHDEPLDRPMRSVPGGSVADRREAPYVYTDEIVLAINLALATSRPLLVRGQSGVGKSALARDIARRQNWSMHEIHITSRTEAQDLLWQFDALKRLQDAQSGVLREDARYIKPGIVWEALDPVSAQAQLARLHGLADQPPPPETPRAVLLLDEVDKADPDFPNNLLTVIGNMSFEVPSLDLRVEAVQPPLIVITTNDEMDLPPAFVRRCIELNIPPATRERLIEIGLKHFPESAAQVSTVMEPLVDRAMSAAKEEGMQVSTAEFIDLVEACQALGFHADSPDLNRILQATVTKPSTRGVL